MKNIKYILIISLTIILTACGNKKDNKNNEQMVSEYINGLQTFYDNVETTTISMNNIDTNSENYKAEMLSYLDDMNGYFKSLSEIEMPEEFKDNSSDITNAYSYMNQSVILYHEALEEDSINVDDVIEAKSYYDKAFEYIQSLGKKINQSSSL